MCGPHGLGPPFSVFLPTLTELTTVFQGRGLWNDFQDPAGTAVLPLLFWAEVLCELEEQGSRTDTDTTWVPPCVLRACSHAAYPSCDLNQALPWQDGDLSHDPNIHSLLPSLQMFTDPGLRTLDIRENSLCPQGVYILVPEDEQ